MMRAWPIILGLAIAKGDPAVVPINDAALPMGNFGVGANDTYPGDYPGIGAPLGTTSNHEDMFSYHKGLWPLSGVEWFTIILSAIGLVIAAGGGIGGGGILVPLYIIFLKFRPKHAIALSNFTILGGSIANTIFNIQKSDSVGGALIDWDIIVMMEPSTIAGAVLGSFFSKYLPDFVLTTFLTLVLALLSYRTLDKGIKMFQKESEDESKRQEREELPLDPMEGACSDDDINESQQLIGREEVVQVDQASPPWCKIFLLTVCFAGCVVLTILKGSGHGSIIGVECGSPSFWILSLCAVPWVFVFGALFRKMLIRENENRAREGHKFDESSEIRWDARTTIKYPIVCTIAGVLAGLFGVGGGIVKGPLMLEMGVNPRVAAATAATMILFTTSAACASFQVFGLLEPGYGALFFLLGLVCTAIGQGVINAWMRSAKRQSPPVLSIGLVMALSTVLVALEAFEKVSTLESGDLLRPSSICSRTD